MAKSFLNGRDSSGASSLNHTLKVANYNSNLLSLNNYADYGIHNFKPAALVYIGANPGNDYDLLVLNKPESTFGRDNQCDHPIISVEISRKHALIKYENNRWWILDLKSTNGLMVDGKRLVAEVMTLLKDGSEIIFAPCEQCNFKFRFNEHYRPSPNSQIKPLHCFSMSNFDRHDCNFVDPSGYESVATQDINMPPSPSNMDFYRILDFYREKQNQLQFENEKLTAQLKEKCDQNRIVSKDSDMEKRKLKHENATLEKKNKNLYAILKKYRILLDQVGETKSQERCALSDDESNHSVTGLNSTAVSNVLKEITCSICSEYLVCPTSLSCSHVFCSHCIDEWKREYRAKYNSASNGICPVCRKEIQCQTQVLSFENVINFLLEDVLNGKEKEDRAKMMETRRQKCSSLTTFSPQQSFSVSAILQQILNGLPRSRRSSIVITSDSDDDGNSHDGHSDGDVSVVSDHSNDGSDVDIRLIAEDGFDFSDSSDEEDFSRSISITVSGGNQNDISVDLALGNDSDDEILMIEDDDSLDDDSSNDSEDVYIGFYDLDEESHQDAIVITDSEDDQVVALPSSTRTRRRSSMIILSDSEDSLPARRNSHQNGLNSTEIITISNDEAAPDGNNSLRRNGGRSRSRRSHPYRRSGQNNNNNTNNNQRRATLCA